MGIHWIMIHSLKDVYTIADFIQATLKTEIKLSFPEGEYTVIEHTWLRSIHDGRVTREIGVGVSRRDRLLNWLRDKWLVDAKSSA